MDVAVIRRRSPQKIVVAADYDQYKNPGCSQEAAPSAACGCLHLQVCYAPKRHGKVSERRKPCWQKTVLVGPFLQEMGLEDAGHGIYKLSGWLTSKKNLGGQISRRAFPMFYRRGPNHSRANRVSSFRMLRVR